MNRRGIAVAGYPGAGKSMAGEALQQKLGAVFQETGDVVRRGAARHFDTPVDLLSSDALGDYSTMRREQDGGDYVMQDVFDNLERDPQFPDMPAVICGMRDSEVPELCEEFFDTFLVVWIEADFDTRLHRLQGRGRQDEASFTEEDLRSRDEREDEWGTNDLYKQRDLVVNNTTTLLDLYARLDAVDHLLV